MIVLFQKFQFFFSFHVSTTKENKKQSCIQNQLVAIGATLVGSAHQKMALRQDAPEMEKEE